jgi:hypothetical protein
MINEIMTDVSQQVMRGEKATQSKERVDIFYIGGKF